MFCSYCGAEIRRGIVVRDPLERILGAVCELCFWRPTIRDQILDDMGPEGTYEKFNGEPGGLYDQTYRG
jgi:hypothetical protein